MKTCKKCGNEFQPTYTFFFQTKQQYCLKCSRKISLPTQEQLAKRAGRKIDDRAGVDANKASAEGLSYGKYMARKK